MYSIPIVELTQKPAAAASTEVETGAWLIHFAHAVANEQGCLVYTFAHIVYTFAHMYSYLGSCTHTYKVGQSRVFTPCMTVNLAISLP